MNVLNVVTWNIAAINNNPFEYEPLPETCKVANDACIGMAGNRLSMEFFLNVDIGSHILIKITTPSWKPSNASLIVQETET